MFQGPETTSDLRQSLCAVICAAVEHDCTERKQWLADALAVLPFESMTDDALVEMAYATVAEPVVTSLVGAKSSYHYALRGRYSCGECLDARVVLGDDYRWHRCPRCNTPHPDPVEARKK